MRILQKHGVVEGWMPESGGGFVGEGISLRERDSIRRTKGQGSIMKEFRRINDWENNLNENVNLRNTFLLSSHSNACFFFIVVEFYYFLNI